MPSTSTRLDPALAGLPSVAAALRSVSSAEPPRLVVVTGAAGSGRRAALDALAAALSTSSRPVVTAVGDLTERSAVLVADDAHRASAEDRRLVDAAVAREDVVVLLGTEPRPHDAWLARLGALAGPSRSLVVERLDRGCIAERARAQNLDLTPTLVARVHTVSGGVLRVVDAVLAELRTAGPDASPDRAATEAFARLLRHHDRPTLTALAVGALGVRPDPPLVSAVTPTTYDDADTAVESARWSGATTDVGDLLPTAAAAIRSILGEHTVVAILRSVIGWQLDHHVLQPNIAMAGAASGIRDERLAAELTRFAERSAPERARPLWEAAQTAGADVAVPFAQSCMAAGDLDRAARLADSVLATETGNDATLRAAVRIAATVAGRRGTPSRSAELYRWLGPERAGSDAAFAASTLLAVGDREHAAAFLAAAATLPPTTGNAREKLIVDGLIESLESTAAVALSSLLRASSMTDAFSDAGSAASVAALLALHTGDPVTARSVLTAAAVDPASAGTRRRHATLMLAWTDMLAGDLGAATALLDSLDIAALTQREALSAHALGVALARRRGDSGALLTAWRAAQRTVAEVEIDLYELLPLGELWLAAVRVGDVDRLAHLVDAADALLARLGDPPAWATTWHWYGVHAAILTESPAALLPHARALGDSAESSAYAATLADAGRAWLRVLQGEPDVAEVERCARALERFGHSWDGAKLASDAALRVRDTKDATTLLQIARMVGSRPQTVVPAAGTAPNGTERAAPTGPLTDREADVARHLMLGLTYREIGAKLYISAKTVEHHVARIRRRLGAESRSEMLSMLRASGYADTDDRRADTGT